MFEKYTHKLVIEHPENLQLENWKKIKYEKKNLSRFNKCYGGYENGKLTIYTKNKFLCFAETLINAPKKLILGCVSSEKKLKETKKPTEEEQKLKTCISVSRNSGESNKNMNIASLRQQAADSVKKYVKKCQIEKGLRNPDPAIEKLYHLKKKCKLTLLENVSGIVDGQKIDSKGYMNNLKAIEHNSKTLKKIIFALKELMSNIDKNERNHELDELIKYFKYQIKELEEKQEKYHDHAKELLNLRKNESSTENASKTEPKKNVFDVSYKACKTINDAFVSLNSFLILFGENENNTFNFDVDKEVIEKIKEKIVEIAKETKYSQIVDELEPLIPEEVINKINSARPLSPPANPEQSAL